MNGMIIVLSGPSGAGKGRVFEEIAKRRNDVKRIPSVTTREIRRDEIPGYSYVYVTKSEFEEMKERGGFFESVLYDGNYYGTPSIPTEELAFKDVFLDKDVRGAMRIKEAYPEAVTIYLMPKDLDTLNQRRGNRGKDRQQIAKDEVELAKKLDFLVINDDIDETIKQVESIIECMRTNSMKDKWNIMFLDEFY